MTAVKRGAVMVIIGSGILDGEERNWACINAKCVSSTFDQHIQRKDTRFVAVVKELGKRAFRVGYEHHIEPFCVHRTVSKAQRANITL